MTPKSVQHVWRLVRQQHGVVSREQLLELGFTADAIRHRLARGRLHRVYRGVYAVGRRELTREGRWMAAVLACGLDAALSHHSAATLWRIRPHQPGPIHVSVPASRRASVPGVIVHRRRELDTIKRNGIPVTTPIATLVDLAATLGKDAVEAAVNEADKHDLCDPETLRAALDDMAPRPGIQALRRILDIRTFTMSDSELERRFRPIARRAGLPKPLTGQWVDGFQVDFWWPELGLVIETDGLRYHRTPAQQARDRVRDQTHLAAGHTPLRFTRAQVRYDVDHVERTVQAVAQRLVQPRNAA